MVVKWVLTEPSCDAATHKPVVFEIPTGGSVSPASVSIHCQTLRWEAPSRQEWRRGKIKKKWTSENATDLATSPSTRRRCSTLCSASTPASSTTRAPPWTASGRLRPPPPPPHTAKKKKHIPEPLSQSPTNSSFQRLSVLIAYSSTKYSWETKLIFSRYRYIKKVLITLWWSCYKGNCLQTHWL